MRESFVMYTSYIDKLERLTDEAFGRLMRGVFEYQRTGETPDFGDVVLDVCFAFIREDLDRNEERWQKRVDNGRKGGRPRKDDEKPKKTIGNQRKPSETKENQAEANACVYVNDNVNDNDNKKNIKKKKTPTVKHRRGECENVMLTDEEYERIQERFPLDYDDRIDKLSLYIASTGKRYKSHYHTLLSWSRREKDFPRQNNINAPKNRSTRTPEQLEEVLSDDIYEVF